jgi:hydroxymethylglutaryl-CoA synthase
MSGVFAQDVNDFWRPLYSKNAQVDGHYSVKCYLDALEGAYRSYQALAGSSGHAHFSDRFAALAYHVPYGKMAVKAHRHLRGLDGDPAPDASFERLVAPSLRFPSEIGNVYTGSLYLALTSLLATGGAELEGQQVGLFSYGSGSCAEFFSGTVRQGATAHVRSLRVAERLASRQRLSVAAYEAIMTAREQMDSRAPASPAPAPFQYLGVTGHRRTYGPAAC